MPSLNHDELVVSLVSGLRPLKNTVSPVEYYYSAHVHDPASTSHKDFED